MDGWMDGWMIDNYYITIIKHYLQYIHLIKIYILFIYLFWWTTFLLSQFYKTPGTAP